MRLVAACAIAFGVATLASRPALAVGQDEADGSPKGLIGGALLGGELVLCVEAAVDVQPTWAYIVGGGLGAVGGGVGGYFVDQEASARVSMLMLAGGLTLAIPTTIAVLSATAYEPPAGYLQDEVPPDEPVADPPKADTSAPAPAAAPAGSQSSNRPKVKTRRVVKRQAGGSFASAKAFRLAPPALFDINPNRIALAIPAVEVGDVFTRTELFELGLKQATEVRVPVLSVTF